MPSLQLPGMANVWVQPIRNRIDMLATGIKSPVGIKIAGPDLATIEQLGARSKPPSATFPAPLRLFRAGSGGRYIEVPIDRRRARYGLEHRRRAARRHGRDRRREHRRDHRRTARFPINVRYPRELRDSVQDLRELPIVTERGETGDARQRRGPSRSPMGRR